MNPVHDMSVAYALDGLEAIERLRFEPHLAECAMCRGDVEDVRDAAELLSVGVELTPPASLRDRVAAIPEVTIAQEAARAPEGSSEPAPDRAPSAGTTPGWLRWFGAKPR